MSSKNIVHTYFKKEIDGEKLLVKIDPIYLKGIELSIAKDGKMEVRVLEFDNRRIDDLKADGFVEVNGMEFNLYDAGLLR